MSLLHGSLYGEMGFGCGCQPPILSTSSLRKSGRQRRSDRRGKPVARIVPFTVQDRTAMEAQALLLARLRSQPTANIGRWTRDELYDETR
jgi:hypothetical protein